VTTTKVKQPLTALYYIKIFIYYDQNKLYLQCSDINENSKPKITTVAVAAVVVAIEVLEYDLHRSS